MRSEVSPRTGCRGYLCPFGAAYVGGVVTHSWSSVMGEAQPTSVQYVVGRTPSYPNAPTEFIRFNRLVLLTATKALMTLTSKTRRVLVSVDI